MFPFFQEIDTPRKLINVIAKKKYVADRFFLCPSVQVFRLQLFSYLYVEDFDNLYSLAEKYSICIQESTYLTETMRNSYFEENNAIMQMVQNDIQTARAYCAKTVEDTIRNCFG